MTICCMNRKPLVVFDMRGQNMLRQEENIRENVMRSHEASLASRYEHGGLTDQKSKLSSKNFDKLMKQRGLSKEDIDNLKASSQSGSSMQTRHAKAGEKFITTHGEKRCSGVFVSEKPLGKTPSERIDKGALPHSNTAEFETTVELSRDQNLVYGTIAPQTKFSKMDPSQAPRTGGGEQVITDGGYNSGAIINRDSKYPIAAGADFRNRVQQYKNKHSSGKQTSQKGSKPIRKNTGQSM